MSNVAVKTTQPPQAEKAPEQAQEHLVAFVNLMEAKKSEKPDDVIAACRRLIDDFVEIKRSEVAKSKCKLTWRTR